jgi:hypothetical protein
VEGKRFWSKLFLHTRDSSNSVLHFQPAVYKIFGLKQIIIIKSKKKLKYLKVNYLRKKIENVVEPVEV